MSQDLTQKQEDRVVELLAIIYNVIDWKKMKTSKNPHDIFNHRVRAASRRATLYEAVSKLSNYFGLQSLPAEAIHIANELRGVEQQVLNKLYIEHVALSMLGIMRAKEMHKARKNKKEEINNEKVL